MFNSIIKCIKKEICYLIWCSFNSNRVLIEPSVTKLIQSYHEKEDLVSEVETRENVFTENQIKGHDLFSIAFMVLSIKIPDLPLVYTFYKDTQKKLIQFDEKKFKMKLDHFFNTIQEEDKFIKIMKRLLGYDNLANGLLLFINYLAILSYEIKFIYFV